MSIDEQFFGAGVPSWADRLVIAKLYDLGKFFFGVGTATIAFLFTAEKISPSGEWESGLKWGFGLLVLAIALSIGMVIAAAPYVKEKLILPATRWTLEGIVIAWFALWAIGTGLGVGTILSP